MQGSSAPAMVSGSVSTGRSRRHSSSFTPGVWPWLGIMGRLVGHLSSHLECALFAIGWAGGRSACLTHRCRPGKRKGRGSGS
jgi:hypothetical protein